MSDPLAAFDLANVRERLIRFLAAQGLAEPEVTGLRRFTVGFSWITFGFHARWREGGAMVDTRSDPAARAAKRHLRALPGLARIRHAAGAVAAAFRCPAVHWHSDDSDAFGAPFFICDFVRGDAPIPWTRDGGPAFDETTRVQPRRTIRRRRSPRCIVSNGAARRSRPSAAPGMSGCAAADRIDVWESLLDQWTDARVPMLEWAAIWLRAHAPVAPRISIVHGDFRIGNFLVDEGRITAILDWEIVRLGDPLEDLGWICMQAWRGRSPYMCHLFTRDELRDRYSRARRASPSTSARCDTGKRSAPTSSR